jgi:hypothetical protein
MFLGEGRSEEEWFGYLADLWHAGVMHAVEELPGKPGVYDTLWKSWEEGWRDIERLGSYPMPSCFQGRLDRFLVDSDEEHADSEDPGTAPTGEAAPGLADEHAESHDTETQS